MARLKYPIGIQDFREIRTKGYHYLDKTTFIHRILTEGKYYFLSRPRRFGKSLLLSTIKEIYSGSRELFEDLWIADHWDWDKRHPVVHIKFAKSDYQGLGLAQAIFNELDKSAAELGVTLSKATFKERFEELLMVTTLAQGRVVLLVDEYDKPIIDYLEAPEQAKANREVLKQFYSVLKDADPYLELVFITGVSKFSKVSIFSDLNNLNDLTLHLQYSTLLGITPEELEKHFGEVLTQMEAKTPDIRHWVRRMYNGYSWDGQHHVYNPFSILNFLSSSSLRNYWFETGTPTFLIDLMRKVGRFVWNEDEFVALLDLASFDLERIDPATILFQTGYLSITELNEPEGWCKLNYPNQEVRASLEQLLLAAYQYRIGSGLPTVLELRQALERNNLDRVVEIINTAFSDIPHDLWKGATELHYHALVHLTFSLLGNYLKSEVNSSLGRCDAIVQTATHIYAFEFKLEQSAAIAIQQIIDKNYLGPFQLDTRQKVAVGINFSREKRGVDEFDWQEIA
ncbi:ATP-binding protein [Haliscomenobacter hydrossis]|uniref:AAA-ATPase n=1 Tax=Haliscomenobacter hydrossis (strain ATCC 27775 / DSM 1100 / LMG 10767 / O) TaxID=760192 RepID=F4L457_HALH1|nr:ATP-binding protein [Haliscomenobacter hydrossis]AEE50755.1 AAA-ATPase [Haliscomenobacter hydrossis DSM 1100]